MQAVFANDGMVTREAPRPQSLDGKALSEQGVLQETGLPTSAAQNLPEAVATGQAVNPSDVADDAPLLSRSAMKDVDANTRRGREAMNRALVEKADRKRAMYRNDLGWIDFVWGSAGGERLTPRRGREGTTPRIKKGMGIAHILHERMNKDGMNYDEAVRFLTESVTDVIARGAHKPIHRIANGERVQVTYNGDTVALVKNKGSNAWTVTAFDSHRKGGASTAGSVDTENATHSKPTLTRQGMVAPDAQTTLPDAAQQVNPASRERYAPQDDTNPVPASHLQENVRESGRDAAQQDETADNQDKRTPSSPPSPEVAAHRERVRDAVRKTVGGKLAARVAIVGRDEAQKVAGSRSLLDNTVEGFYIPSERKIVLVADNLSAERAQWVVWHEFAHAGLHVRLADKYLSAMRQVLRHNIMEKLADAIQETYRQSGESISREVAAEEALAEVFAAYKRGDFAALQKRYGVDVSAMRDVDGYLQRVANRLRAMFAEILGRAKDSFTDADVFALLKDIDATVREMGEAKAEGENAPSEGLRFSIYQDRADMMARALESVGVETRRESSRVSNSEYLYAQIPGRSDEFGDPLEVKFRISDHTLPKHYESADYDVDTGKQAEHSAGDWLDAVKWLVDKYGLKMPAVVKRAETRAQKPATSAPSRRRNPDAKEIRELKKDIAEYRTLIADFERHGSVVDKDHLYRQALARDEARLAELKERAQSEGLRFSRRAVADSVALNRDGFERLSQRKAGDDIRLSVYHRRNNRDTPDNDVGYMQFADSDDNIEHYGKNHWVLPEGHDDVRVRADSEVFRDALRGYIEDNLDYLRAKDFPVDEQGFVDSMLDAASPDDIVDSAGLWDSDIVHDLWDEVLEPNGWLVVETPDGAVVFDADLVERADDDIRFSLKESPDSEFARAVDKVVNGKVPAGYIDMGTTPDVLKMVGVPDGKVRISGGTIEKVISDFLSRQNNYDKNRHAVRPEDLKLLPENMNNPIAVFKSSSKADAFVVLTELVERVKGEDKPVIAALHLNKSKRGLDLVDVASVYGRNDSQLVSAFSTDLLYLNKEKGRQFLKAHPLQLHWDITSDANLSRHNIKTNEDLGQADGVKFSRTEDNGLARVPLDKAGSKRRSWFFPKEWTNERGELLAGARAYEKLGSLLQPALAKARMVNTHPESFTQYMRDFRAQKNTAGLVAKDVARQMAGFTQEERELLSDILEKELPPKVLVSPELQEVAGVIRELFNRQSDELVKLEMLSPESAGRFRDTYLPRLYRKHMSLFDQTDLGKVNREFARAYKNGLGQAIAGSHLKGRGIFKEVARQEKTDGGKHKEAHRRDRYRFPIEKPAVLRPKRRRSCQDQYSGQDRTAQVCGGTG